MNDLSHSRINVSASRAIPMNRTSERTPLIRTAKLVFEDGEYPCILRDISGTALRVKLYGARVPDDSKPFWLEFGDGDRFEVALIWVRDGHAGLAFTEHNDLMSLIGEKGPFLKRSVRIAVDLPATVQSLGRALPVVIRNLSHQGAQIQSEQMFSMDQQVRIDVPALGEVYAKVRWRQHPDYGLAFVETFRFEEIAEVAGSLQALSNDWRKANGERGGEPSDMVA